MTKVGQNCVVLFSGGLDSTTVVALAQNEGFTINALTIDYGQKHRVEIERAREVASKLQIAQHRIMKLDLAAFGGSSLTSTTMEIPKFRSETEISSGIPNTYVPARNLVFLSIAASWAETLNTFDLFIGVNIVDYSGYPDCRPEFINSFEQTANLGTRSGVEGSDKFSIHAPLSGLSKSEIIKMGVGLGLDYSMTHSCYDPAPDGRACGSCDSCLLRKKGFAEAKVDDPTKYVSM